MAIRLSREKLYVLEHSKDHLVLQEGANYIIGGAFALFAVGGAVAEIYRASNTVAGCAIVGLICLWLLILGLLGLVKSTISIDRKSGILRLRRRLLGIDFERPIWDTRN